jgi:outer membrane protein
MNRTTCAAALTAAALGAAALSTPAAAADLPSSKLAPVAPVMSQSWNPWQFRLRASYVVPNDGSTVYAGGARVVGGKTDISNTLVPTVDITYYFTPNIAAELILGVTPHNAKGAGTLAGLGKLGSTWLLPPTLTLQYHFTGFGAFKPYVGAGVNYTVFFSNKDNALTNFRVKDSFGGVLQIGFDYMLTRNWGLNVDVKKLFLRPTATGLLGLTPVRAKLDLDPWIISTGVTYKF